MGIVESWIMLHVGTVCKPYHTMFSIWEMYASVETFESISKHWIRKSKKSNENEEREGEKRENWKHTQAFGLEWWDNNLMYVRILHHFPNKFPQIKHEKLPLFSRVPLYVYAG